MNIKSLIKYYNSLNINPKDKVSTNIKCEEFLIKLSSKTSILLKNINEKDLENFFNLIILFSKNSSINFVKFDSYKIIIENISNAFLIDENVSFKILLSMYFFFDFFFDFLVYVIFSIWNLMN